MRTESSTMAAVVVSYEEVACIGQRDVSSRQHWFDWMG